MKRSLFLALLVAGLTACTKSPPERRDPAPERRDPAPAGPSVSGFGFTVANLEQATQFFVDQLGAKELSRRSAEGPELDALTALEAAKAQAVILELGEERITLTQFAKPGQPTRKDAVSNDLDFQHLALVVRDMDAAYAKLAPIGISEVSRDGPQRIPDSNVAAAGIRAFYFRDAERHPLELIWFPEGKGEKRWHRSDGPLVLGIDHSAIAVSSTDRSLSFYRDGLGLRVAGKSLNKGIEQERLSGVEGAVVRITGLRGRSGPGVEFLEYIAPGPGRKRSEDSTPRDLFHWETSVVVQDLEAILKKLRAGGAKMISKRIAKCELCLDGGKAVLVRDPDAHALRLIQN